MFNTMPLCKREEQTKLNVLLCVVGQESLYGINKILLEKEKSFCVRKHIKSIDLNLHITYIKIYDKISFTHIFVY